MATFTKESNITILKKERPIQQILDTLIFLPADELVNFFAEINLSFPRSIRIDALKTVLRDSVNETRAERATLADEMNYRLSWFNQYSETQLVNLLKFYKNNELNKLALEEISLGLINYMTTKHIAEKDFNKLINLSISHVKKEDLKLPEIMAYNKSLNALFFDEPGKIDGLTLDVIRPVLYKSSTLTEIREVGTKYGVNVPKRLKKSELVAIIVDELKTRGDYTEEKEAEINKMSVLLIQRFAKNNDIKVSTELKKEEIIEYILANAKETREKYFVPSSSVYELEVKDIGEEMPDVLPAEEEPVVVEEVIEEPIVEEVEPVEETPVVEEAPVEEKPEVIEEVLLEEEIEEEETFNDELFTEQPKQDKPLVTVKTSNKDAKRNRKLILKDQARKKDEIAHTTNENIHRVIISGFNESGNGIKKKKGNFFVRLLKALLVILIIFLIFLALYGILRPLGGFTSGVLQSVDNFLNKITFGLLDKFTDLIK